ncbi:hypothetical protein [Chitinilyticum piscinae]|uniref:Uncharacterized protein n=1 Tax=Chitinilyticum piscinae TaxID=2866724 RepID=A0A8J7KEI2_9NEIS|nr:hypothetical protein [Chitinilyticum piscinae]MBE9609564.1 hypothetical protein [Chitinilyticum piscinae]
MKAWLAIMLLAGAQAAVLEPAGPLETAISPTFGVNLGGSSYWGAEQLRANIVRNPGFEPLQERSLVIVDKLDGGRITDRDAWASRPDALWTGGRYQVLTGQHAGQSGAIRDYRRREGQAGQFWLDPALPAAQPGDAISVGKSGRLVPIPQWWSQGRVSLVAYQNGQHAARLLVQPGQPASLVSHFDTLGGQAGRLLPVSGEWVLRLKARTENGKVRLLARFARNGQPPFVQQTVDPAAQWQMLEWRFSSHELPAGPPAPMALSLEAVGDGEIWIDEVYLGEAASSAGGFRRAVLDSLKLLAPGYLRDWQGQLGDTVANRFVGEFHRQPVRYRPGDAETFYPYSIPELFELCAATGSRPWVIGPTTLSAEEWREFALRLRQEADRHQLDEVVLEFGNENWNALFRPAGLTDVAKHREAVERAFAAARQGFGKGRRLLTVANAPFLWPDSPGAIVNANGVDRIAVAPYFMYELGHRGDLTAQRREALSSQLERLAQQQSRVRAAGKRLAVYEINFHTTLGEASAVERNRILASSIAGVGLARQLLEARLAGVRELAVYSLAGYSVRLDAGKGDVALFGITRDLAASGRWRPTGLALQQLNELGPGVAWRVQCRGAGCADLVLLGLAAAPGAVPQRYAILNSGSGIVNVELACSGALRRSLLDGRLPGSNEGQRMEIQLQRSTLACQSGRANDRIPAESLVVLQPGGG